MADDGIIATPRHHEDGDLEDRGFIAFRVTRGLSHCRALGMGGSAADGDAGRRLLFPIRA